MISAITAFGLVAAANFLAGALYAKLRIWIVAAIVGMLLNIGVFYLYPLIGYGTGDVELIFLAVIIALPLGLWLGVMAKPAPKPTEDEKDGGTPDADDEASEAKAS